MLERERERKDDLNLSADDIALFKRLLKEEFSSFDKSEQARIIALAKNRSWKNGKGFKEVFYEYIKTQNDEEILAILKNIVNKARAVGEVFWTSRDLLGSTDHYSGLLGEIHTEYNRRISDPNSLRAKVYFPGSRNKGLDKKLAEALSKLPEDKEERQKILNAQDQQGNTAVYYAASCQNHWALEKLIAAGADVNIGNLSTPLQFAIIGVDMFVVEKLVKAGADLNRATVNWNRWTYESQSLMTPAEVALMNYEEKGEEDGIIYFLWKNGANIEKAISAAVEYGRLIFLRNFTKASGLEFYNWEYAGDNPKYQGKKLFEIAQGEMREFLREQAIIPVIKALCENELKFEDKVLESYAKSTGYAGEKSFRQKVFDHIRSLPDSREAKRLLEDCLKPEKQLGNVFMTYSSDHRPYGVFTSERDKWKAAIQAEIAKNAELRLNDAVSAQYDAKL